MAEILKFSEQDELTPKDKIYVALASVQGSWDKKSRELLLEQSVFDGAFETKGVSRGEKLLINAVKKAVGIFFKDGSQAQVLFGHQITLEREDRGLVVLQALIADKMSETQLENEAKWRMSALLSAAIAGGDSFENISSKLKGGMEKIAGTVAWAMKAAKKMFQEEGGMSQTEDDLFPDATKGILDELRKLYGGSDEALLTNKEKLKKEIIKDFRGKIRTMKHTELLTFSDKLKIQTGEPMVDSSIKAAKEIFAGILKGRSENINEVLESLSN